MPAIFDEDQQHLDPTTKSFLVGGKVYIGDVGVDPIANPKAVYGVRALTGAALAQPLIIGADGRVSTKMWTSGKYSYEIRSSADVQKYQELDNGIETQGVVSLTTQSLGVNDITAVGVPIITSLVDNQTYIITVPAINTGNVTLKIDSTPVTSVRKNHDEQIGVGDLKASQKLFLIFNATDNWFEAQLLTTELFDDKTPVFGGDVNLNNKQFTGVQTLSAGADIASATATDLTAATGNAVVITGTATATSLTMTTGQQMLLLPSGAWPLTFHATTMNINGGVDYTAEAGDRIFAVKDLAGVIRVNVVKQDGTAMVSRTLTTASTTGASQSIDFSSNKIQLSTADAATVTYTFATPAAVAKVDLIIDYEAVVSYDVANASYDSVSFSVASEDSAPNALAFKTDGTKMYMVGTQNDTVDQYTLASPWVVSSATYDSVSFDFNTQEAVVFDMFFKPDGTKIYIIGQNDTVYQYALSTAWVVSSASYESLSFSVNSQDAVPQAIFFKPDGSKMYMIGNTNDTIYQYTLSTPWAMNTASYDSVSFSFASQENNPRSVFFKPDGTKMYIAGRLSDSMYQYTLSTPWVVSSASYDSVTFSFESEETALNSVVFKPDGTKMYAVGQTADTVFQYNSSQVATLVFPATLEAPALPLSVSEKTAVTIVTVDSGTSYQVISTLGGIL
jgi:sugar lactone lactonase YvrE